MTLIKRYPNRKLYDTTAKRYITLAAVGAMLRRGEAVRVVDHASGEDLTSVVMMQVIVEEQKRGAGVLPLPVIASLLQAGGSALAGIRRQLDSPLEFLHQVDEEIQRRMEHLVALGDLADDEARLLLLRLLDPGVKSPFRGAAGADDGTGAGKVSQPVSSQIPTRDDLANLQMLIDRLAVEVEGLRRREEDLPREE
jgi:polyhydroxyalkanoate synthesis repressor PhaR